MRDARFLRAAALSLVIGCCVALMASVAFSSEGVPAKVCGDVNGDAKITASDALRVLIKSVGIDVQMRCNNRRNYHEVPGPLTVTVPPDLYPD